jgi:hypothetical protein
MIEIESIDTILSKSRTHQEFSSFVCEKVVKSPSIARDAPNLTAELRKLDDWLAILPSAILTPDENI